MPTRKRKAESEPQATNQTKKKAKGSHADKKTTNNRKTAKQTSSTAKESTSDIQRGTMALDAMPKTINPSSLTNLNSRRHPNMQPPPLAPPESRTAAQERHQTHTPDLIDLTDEAEITLTPIREALPRIRRGDKNKQDLNRKAKNWCFEQEMEKYRKWRAASLLDQGFASLETFIRLGAQKESAQGGAVGIENWGKYESQRSFREAAIARKKKKSGLRDVDFMEVGGLKAER